MDTAGFLDRLWQIQEQRGLNDATLARRLGVNQSTVHRLKAGQREHPSLRVVLAVIREFPELGVLLSSDLRQGRSTMRSRKDEGVR